MNKKFNGFLCIFSLILILLAVNVFSSLKAKYAQKVSVTDAMSLDVKAGEYDPYTIQFHTSRDSIIDKDYIYKTVTVRNADTPVTVIDFPAEPEGYTPVSWSTAGVSLIDGNTYKISDYGGFREFDPGETFTVSDILGDGSRDYQAAIASAKVLHIYATYKETTITVEPLDSTKTGGISWTIYSESALTGASHMIGLRGSGGDVVKFYAHPGLSYMWVGDTMEGYSRCFANGKSTATTHSFTMDMETKTITTSSTGGTDSGGTEGSCFAAGTQITLADGSRVPVEELKTSDVLRVYDHEKGCYTTAPILFVEDDGVKEYTVINLLFSDGTHTKLIYEHGLFDLNLNQYVYITEENYDAFVGHRFVKESEDGYKTTVLEKAYLEKEVIGCYSLTTNYYINYFIDEMLSMPGGITGLFNYFAYGENLAYDEEKMLADIEQYGLYTAQDFAQYLPEEVFHSIYPVKYLKVSVGKGLMRFEDILAIIERYVKGHGLV